MSPWFAKAIVVVGSLAMLVIPHRLHPRRGVEFKVLKSRRGPLERVLLTLVAVGFLLPLLWVATPALAFADYPLDPIVFSIGVACVALGLWLFYRSHSDLGANWSITLEVRAEHVLVTEGIYRHVRHPMYSSLLLYSLGQALVVPNWVAGPAYAVACALLFVLRVVPEERMMLDEFGKEYEAYRARTKRLVPGVW